MYAIRTMVMSNHEEDKVYSDADFHSTDHHGQNKGMHEGTQRNIGLLKREIPNSDLNTDSSERLKQAKQLWDLRWKRWWGYNWTRKRNRIVRKQRVKKNRQDWLHKQISVHTDIAANNEKYMPCQCELNCKSNDCLPKTDNGPNCETHNNSQNNGNRWYNITVWRRKIQTFFLVHNISFTNNRVIKHIKCYVLRKHKFFGKKFKRSSKRTHITDIISFETSCKEEKCYQSQLLHDKKSAYNCNLEQQCSKQTPYSLQEHDKTSAFLKVIQSSNCHHCQCRYSTTPVLEPWFDIEPEITHTNRNIHYNEHPVDLHLTSIPLFEGSACDTSLNYLSIRLMHLCSVLDAWTESNDQEYCKETDNGQNVNPIALISHNSNHINVSRILNSNCFNSDKLDDKSDRHKLDVEISKQFQPFVRSFCSSTISHRQMKNNTSSHQLKEMKPTEAQRPILDISTPRATSLNFNDDETLSTPKCVKDMLAKRNGTSEYQCHTTSAMKYEKQSTRNCNSELPDESQHQLYNGISPLCTETNVCTNNSPSKSSQICYYCKQVHILHKEVDCNQMEYSSNIHDTSSLNELKSNIFIDSEKTIYDNTMMKEDDRKHNGISDDEPYSSKIHKWVPLTATYSPLNSSLVHRRQKSSIPHSYLNPPYSLLHTYNSNYRKNTNIESNLILPSMTSNHMPNALFQTQIGTPTSNSCSTTIHKTPTIHPHYNYQNPPYEGSYNNNYSRYSEVHKSFLSNNQLTNKIAQNAIYKSDVRGQYRFGEQFEHTSIHRTVATQTFESSFDSSEKYRPLSMSNDDRTEVDLPGPHAVPFNQYMHPEVPKYSNKGLEYTAENKTDTSTTDTQSFEIFSSHFTNVGQNNYFSPLKMVQNDYQDKIALQYSPETRFQNKADTEQWFTEDILPDIEPSVISLGASIPNIPPPLHSINPVCYLGEISKL